MALDANRKDLLRVLESAMEKQFIAPVEDIPFARLPLCGELVLLRCTHGVPGLLFHVSKQIVKFRVVPLSQHSLDLPASPQQIPCFKVNQSQIVAICVMRRVKLVGFFEVGNSGF